MAKVFLVRDRHAFSTKWLCDFGSNLQKMKYNVTIVCDQKNYDVSNNVPINKDIKKINLGQKKSIFAPLKFKALIKKENPDIIFAYFLKDLLNLSLVLYSHKVIMMMHNPPVEVFEKIKNPIMRYVYKKLLKKATAVQVLMPEFIEQIHNLIGDCKVEVIPNQVMTQEQQKDYSKNTKTIIHVAQIAEYNKRQHILIEAFAKLANKHPDWKVHFYGQAKKGKHTRYYNRCKQRITELKLEDRVIFKGFSKNITQDYLNAEINTLPSRSEGFGYGLADGLALGLPSVGFKTAAAINEIIVDGKSGYLVNDINDYAEKLNKLMSDDKLREKLGTFGRKDMQERYSPGIVMAAWDKLIKEII